MSMVRTHDGHNLAVGEPFFLQDVYKDLYPTDVKSHLQYPQLQGEKSLLNELAWRYPGKHVVVTIGAKQGLMAACYALREYRRTKKMVGGRAPIRFTEVVHEAPYWPTYPTIAKLSKLKFRAVPDNMGAGAGSIRVLTAPNNPDGRMDYGNREWEIWDAAYAAPVYGWDFQVPRHRISVWSAAKLFGPSSYRVGWLVTGEKALADLAAQYVEKTTSGVPVPCQDFVAALLKNVRESHPSVQELLQRKARETLHYNADILDRSFRYHKLMNEIKGFPSTGKGMFAWIKTENSWDFDEILRRAGIKVVKGEHCGADPEAGWYRISLGQTRAKMKAAMEALDGPSQRG